jgi:hypothetical protein
MGLLRRAGLAVLGQQPAAREGSSPGGGLRKRTLKLIREAPADASTEELIPPPQQGPVVEPGPAGQQPGPAPAVAATESAGPAPAASATAIPVPAAPPAPSAADILALLRAIPDSVELPSHVFGVLKESLAIRRGTLLLYDPVRMVYAPWASCGLDQTTLRRLRISLGALPSFNALANGKALLVEGGQALAEYQRHFSTREFSSLERLVLAPFIAEEKMVGVLLVAEAAPPFDDPRRLASFLDEVAQAASPAMRRARGQAMTATAAPPAGAAAPLPEQLARFLAAPRAAEAPVLFIALQTGAFERRVLDAHPYLDPFRLHEDVRYFVGAFASDLGAAFALPNGGFLLGLRGLDSRGVDLVTHQLGCFLASLFGSYNGHGAQLDVTATRVFPEAGSDPTALAAAFTP